MFYGLPGIYFRDFCYDIEHDDYTETLLKVAKCVEVVDVWLINDVTFKLRAKI